MPAPGESPGVERRDRPGAGPRFAAARDRDPRSAVGSAEGSSRRRSCRNGASRRSVTSVGGDGGSLATLSFPPAGGTAVWSAVAGHPVQVPLAILDDVVGELDAEHVHDDRFLCSVVRWVSVGTDGRRRRFRAGAAWPGGPPDDRGRRRRHVARSPVGRQPGRAGPAGAGAWECPLRTGMTAGAVGWWDAGSGTTREPVAQVIGAVPRPQASEVSPRPAIVLSGVVIIGLPPSGLVGVRGS